MNTSPIEIVILGLSITSSWGNGHATTFRGLVKALNNNGHRITFLERDVPWYASHRDLPNPPFCQTILYNNLDELKQYAPVISNADLVIVGSYVPQGVEVGKYVLDTAERVTAFYDIDTPVTLAKLQNADYEYLHPDLISRYDLYLSFTGGPTLRRLEDEYGSPMARALYCSFDTDLYYPEKRDIQWNLGYLGTYSDDRQPALKALMLDAAEKFDEGKFVVAGAQYPPHIHWHHNVQRIEHLPPSEHREFYNSQCFTLNITRQDMKQAGYSPSVRLFEAAACGTPIISDYWEGIDEIFEIGSEILIAHSADDTIRYLKELDGDARHTIGLKARDKMMAHHSAAHRAAELENYFKEAHSCKSILQPQQTGS